MGISSTLLYGKQLNQDGPVLYSQSDMVVLPGNYKNKVSNVGISMEVLSKHILFLGGTGCGKTNVINYFIDQLKKKITEKDVMIVFDTKGDFIKRFWKDGDVVIANSKSYSDLASNWNIYKELVADGWDDSELVLNSREICQSLFLESIEKNNSQPFFPMAASDLLSAILIAHLRLGKDNLEFKKKFLNNKNLKYYLDIATSDKISDFIGDFPDLASALNYLGDGSSDQALGVMAELQSVVRQVFVGSFASHGNFTIRDFVKKKEGKTLFVEYDLTKGNTLTPIYRILFDLALKEAMGRNSNEGNVYFICDEFKLLPHLQHIEDGVNFGRSLGVKIMAGIQSIEQLYEIYGESRGRNIAAGFSTVFAFKANDAASREFVENLYGKNLLLENYKGLSNNLIEEKRIGNTVEDWDMTQLKVGEAIIGFPFTTPFTFQTDIYR